MPSTSRPNFPSHIPLISPSPFLSPSGEGKGRKYSRKTTQITVSTLFTTFAILSKSGDMMGRKEESIQLEDMERILIVEDSTIFRTLLKETLESQLPAMEILEASDGEEAIEQLKKNNFDLLICDA
jgi:PleD family two-component response regulator